MIRDRQRSEIWRENKEYLKANNEWGMCNTGSGVEIICVLGGINCNVDHVWIKLSNENRETIPRRESRL